MSFGHDSYGKQHIPFLVFCLEYLTVALIWVTFFLSVMLLKMIDKLQAKIQVEQSCLAMSLSLSWLRESLENDGSKEVSCELSGRSWGRDYQTCVINWKSLLQTESSPTL